MMGICGTFLRRLVQPELNPRSPVGQLSESELDVVYALFEVLTDDLSYPRELVVAEVHRLTTQHAGYFDEYKQGLKLIRKKSINGAFEQVSIEERERVVHSMLRSYAHMENISWIRQQLRLTGENLDGLIAPKPLVRFRHFVVRSLLALYYRGAPGWAVVGYEKYPGMVLSDAEPGTIVAVVEDHGRLLIELADETFETVKTENIVLINGEVEHVKTKGGKQKSTFAAGVTAADRQRVQSQKVVPAQETESVS